MRRGFFNSVLCTVVLASAGAAAEESCERYKAFDFVEIVDGYDLRGLSCLASDARATRKQRMEANLLAGLAVATTEHVSPVIEWLEIFPEAEPESVKRLLKALRQAYIEDQQVTRAAMLQRVILQGPTSSSGAAAIKAAEALAGEPRVQLIGASETIAFSKTNEGISVVPGVVAGRQTKVLFDSGSNSSFVSVALARDPGFRFLNMPPIRGAAIDGDHDFSVAIAPRIEL